MLATMAVGLGLLQYLAVFRGQTSCAAFVYSFLKTLGWVAGLFTTIGVLTWVSVGAESSEVLTAQSAWWTFSWSAAGTGFLLTSLANWNWYLQLFGARAADLPRSTPWQITLGELLLIITLGSTILGLASATANFHAPV